MKAAALHDHGDALERAAHELTLVPGRPGLGEPGDLAVWDAHGTLDRIRDPSQPRAEHDRDARLELPESPRHDVGRLPDRTAPCSLLPAPHSNIPASVADRKFASVPAIMARNPSRARSCLRSGERADAADLDADRTDVGEPAQREGGDGERYGVELPAERSEILVRDELVQHHALAQ